MIWMRIHAIRGEILIGFTIAVVVQGITDLIYRNLCATFGQALCRTHLFTVADAVEASRRSLVHNGPGRTLTNTLGWHTLLNGLGPFLEYQLGTDIVFGTVVLTTVDAAEAPASTTVDRYTAVRFRAAPQTTLIIRRTRIA
tara:strand:+ start:3478 stop:3900 length:423 start_codon:yes stop_codon:yes gene_type:complete